MSFQPAQTGLKTQRAPTSYEFIGSNDALCNDDAAWTVLCEDNSDQKWRDYWQVKYCKVKKGMKAKFRCLGMRILNNYGGPTDGWISLRNFKMWERITTSGNNAFRIVTPIEDIP